MIITVIERWLPIGRIDDHHCIERWLFVLLIWPIGRIDDHHCIERWLFVLLIWPIGRIDGHHCIERCCLFC